MYLIPGISKTIMNAALPIKEMYFICLELGIQYQSEIELKWVKGFQITIYHYVRVGKLGKQRERGCCQVNVTCHHTKVTNIYNV